jgi:monofunctional biosynthetic peptidoglycan transglycosylase
VAGRPLLLLAIACALLVIPTVLPVIALRWLAPPTSAFMLRACDVIDYLWVDWDGISPHLPIAVVAAEDQHFPDHSGFDFDSIAAALRERDRGPVRGASTISQQVAKNLFLWSERSWLRKALEAYFTTLIELAWPKRRILEVYLNVAQFGPCTFGAQAASVRFFGVPASRLAPRQAAILAAVLPNPLGLRADRPSSYVNRRVAWIVDQVRRLGGPAYLAAL